MLRFLVKNSMKINNGSVRSDFLSGLANVMHNLRKRHDLSAKQCKITVILEHSSMILNVSPCSSPQKSANFQAVNESFWQKAT